VTRPSLYDSLKGKIVVTLSRYHSTEQSLLSVDDTLQKLKLIAPAQEIARIFAAWSVAPVLDALYFARTAHKYAQELRSLQRGAELEQSRFFDRNLREGREVPPRTLVIADQFVDSESRVFKMYEGDTPTTQAVDVGLRVAFDGFNSASGIRRLVETELYERLVASGKFIAESFHESEQTYSFSPWDPPSVFGVFSSVSAICTYRRMYRLMPTLVPNLPFHLETVATGLVRADFTKEESKIFGFRELNDDFPSLAPTENVFRIAGFLRSEYPDLESSLRKKGTKVANLVRLCWDEESGGFRKGPSLEFPPDLLHTRYALQLIRALLHLECIDPNELVWLDAGAVLRFLYECQSDGVFTHFPGSIPSICSERFGLNALKVALLLVREGDLHSSGEYRYYLDLLQKKVLSSVGPFVESCKIPQSDLYLAFPLWIIAEELNQDGTDRADSTDDRGITMVNTRASWREIYQKLKIEFKVDELSPEALRSLAEDGGAEEFLSGWLYFLRNREELLKKHYNYFVAIIDDRVIASALSVPELHVKLEDFGERRPFVTLVE